VSLTKNAANGKASAFNLYLVLTIALQPPLDL
jgi:hypothetical protein